MRKRRQREAGPWELGRICRALKPTGRGKRERLQQRRRQQVALSLWTQTHAWDTDAWWLLVTSKASVEKLTSAVDQWMQQTAIAVELFGFRCPPGEGGWPVPILEREASWAWWLPLLAPHVRARVQVGRRPRSYIQAVRRHMECCRLHKWSFSLTARNQPDVSGTKRAGLMGSSTTLQCVYNWLARINQHRSGLCLPTLPVTEETCLEMNVFFSSFILFCFVFTCLFLFLYDCKQCF